MARPWLPSRGKPSALKTPNVQVCHSEPVTDVTGVGIHIPRLGSLREGAEKNGLPHQSADWFAMTDFEYHSSLLAPHSSLLTPNSSLLTPHSNLPILYIKISVCIILFCYYVQAELLQIAINILQIEEKTVKKQGKTLYKHREDSHRRRYSHNFSV